jgi:hypothetical protein
MVQLRRFWHRRRKPLIARHDVLRALADLW